MLAVYGKPVSLDLKGELGQPVRLGDRFWCGYTNAYAPQTDSVIWVSIRPQSQSGSLVCQW